VATADVVQGRAQSSSFDSPFTALADLIRPDTFGFATDSGFGAAGVTRVAVGKGFAPAPAGATTVPATFVPTTIGFGTGAPVPDAPVPVTPPDAAVSSDGKIVISDGSGPVGQILIDPSGGSGNGFQFGQFPVDVQPQAKVAGVRLWVAWLLTSIVIGGLALLVAVRRVSLPSARDSS
jgi:hypothetical protein